MIARELSSPYVISIADARERQRSTKRTCAHDGCGTILSQYNDSTYCAAHEPETEVFEHQGYRFRVCRCGEVYQVNKAGGAPICSACKRDIVERERAAQRKPKPLRKDGRKDAVQRAQARITAERRISAVSPRGVMKFEERSA